MRIRAAILTGILALTLGACARRDESRPNHSTNAAARDAGKAAYHLAQGTKKVAKEAGHQIRVAGEQAMEGWDQAKQADRAKHAK